MSYCVLWYDRRLCRSSACALVDPGKELIGARGSLSRRIINLAGTFGFIIRLSVDLSLIPSAVSSLVVQRFVPTHRRNTSDYSSDSSSTGNSPETQHNVS